MPLPESASEPSSRPTRSPRSSRSADTPLNASTPEPETSDRPTEQDIRLCAYYLSLERNDQPGDPVADWLRAEHEAMMNRPEAEE